MNEYEIAILFDPDLEIDIENLLKKLRRFLSIMVEKLLKSITG